MGVRGDRERLDWWVPALYTRLRSGRLWYVPGFADEQVSFEKWPVLLRRIQERRCTPIVGAGVLEPLIGSPREIARRWAEPGGYLAAATPADLARDQLLVLLEQNEWNIARVARILDVTPQSIHQRTSVVLGSPSEVEHVVGHLQSSV